MQTALVTGVSRGLGRCITRVLKDSGYRVLGIGLAESPLNDALDDYRQVDLGESRLSVPFEDEPVDVLVNSAAVYLDDPRQGYGDVLQLDVRDLRRTLDVNLVGPTALVLAYVPGMLGRCTGRLVNISSGMGRLSDADGNAFAYRASKLAINCLTLSVAQLFASSGDDLAAFSYCPGSIRTSMGTEHAPGEVQPAAEAVVDLLARPPEATNGRFFRHRDELGWDIVPGSRPVRRGPAGGTR